MTVQPTETDRRAVGNSRPERRVRSVVLANNRWSRTSRGPQPRGSFWILHFLVVHDESRGSARCGVTQGRFLHEAEKREKSRDLENRSVKTTLTVLTTCRYEPTDPRHLSMYVYREEFLDSNRANSARDALFGLSRSGGAMEVAVRFDLRKCARY